MIFHIDGVLIIGRISQIPSWWNIECKVTIFFANTQILVYLCSRFGVKTNNYIILTQENAKIFNIAVVNRIGRASNG